MINYITFKMFLITIIRFLQSQNKTGCKKTVTFAFKCYYLLKNKSMAMLYIFLAGNESDR